jgi:hypothetical protein
MTQLIENKPPRCALIATLLHFSKIDRGYRLEIGLTPFEINTNALSNRRWIGISGSEESLAFRSNFSAVSSRLASETGAADVLYSVRGNR